MSATRIAKLRTRLCEQAEESCRLALEYAPDYAHGSHCLGLVALMCAGDLDRAASHFKAALASDADFAEAHSNLGITFLRRIPPDYEAAREGFAAALEIAPGYRDARENLALTLLRMGTIAGDQGKIERRGELFAEARRHLIRLLEIEPGRVRAQHYLGFMALVEGRDDEAEHRLGRCLALAPGDPVCSYELGNVQLRKARCDQAIVAYVGSLSSDPNSDVAADARRALSAAYAQCALQDRALASYVDAIRDRPLDPAIHYDLGKLYAEKGLLDHAVREWEIAVRIEPRYCAAYQPLAEHARATLDSEAATRWCRALIACTSESPVGRPVDPAAVTACREFLVDLGR